VLTAIWKAALLGAAHGTTECTVLFLTSDRRTLANDWFLAVMVVFANATGFAVAARYGVSLIGVALAGLTGMMVGGWVGVHTIGSYEYTVPTPREDREMRIIAKSQERVIELKDVPEETVKRIPIGGGMGVLVGFAVGTLVYARLRRPQDEEPDDTNEELDAEPAVKPDPAE
jgi:hypothetical protein